MLDFNITSKSGADFGVFHGRSPEAALLALHREAGYSHRVVWLESAVINGQRRDWLAFDTRESVDLLGDVGDWIITEAENHG